MDDEARRPRGAGSIQERRGKFQVRLYLPGSTRKSRTFSTREDAETFLRGAPVLQLRQAAELAAKQKPVETLLTYGKKWLEQRELSGIRNIKTDHSCWKRRIAWATFAKEPLHTITRRDVKDWLLTLSKRKALTRTWSEDKRIPKGKQASKLSRQSVVHALNLLRSCLQSAVEDELLEDNPAQDLRVPKAPSSEAGWTHLTAEEIAKVTGPDSPLPEAPRLLVTVAIYTGLRAGELWGLHWDDVRLEGPRPELVIRFSHKGPTKSGKIRHVPLLPPALLALTRWKLLCPPSDEGLVFPTVTGQRRPASETVAGPIAWWREGGRWRGGRVRPGSHARCAFTTCGTRVHRTSSWARGARRGGSKRSGTSSGTRASS
jgi:integrase